MSLFAKAYGIIRRALSLSSPDGWRSSASVSHAGELVTEHTALALSAVWACCNLLSGTIASLPLMVYRTDGKGGRSVASDHPLYRILHDSPNADQTAMDFWEYSVLGMELWGNSFARKDMIGGRLVGLTPIRPDSAMIERAMDGRLRYRWTENGKSFDVTEESIFHVRGFGGSPMGGLSTLAFARHSFGLASAIDRAAGATFANGLRHSGVLTFEQFLKDDQRKIAEDKLVAKFAGAMNSGRPLVLEGGAKWEQITISPEDAQMLESRAFSVEEVCRFFGVPPFMVGHTEKSTSWGTGLEQQTMAFQKFTLRRRLKRIEQAIEKQLLTAADRAAGLVVEFSLEGLLRGDSKSRAEFYGALLNAGVMTINEVRTLENLPPVTGGDVPRIQTQNQPITVEFKPQALKPQEPPP